MRGFILLLLMLCSFKAVLAEVKTIRAIVSDSNAPPFALFDQDSNLAGGISKDILEALANHSQLVLQYLALPRGRVEQWLLRDDADIACFLNPDWVEQPEQLLWSNSLFNTRQVIIRRNNSPAIQKMTDLLGKRLGTDRGFSYPEFDKMFSQRLLIRDDATSLEVNASRLQKLRLDAVLAVDLAYHYYQQTHDSEGSAADPFLGQSQG
ncbi:substrate-binding periplasmic protein [Alishewanella longhuensis]